MLSVVTTHQDLDERFRTELAGLTAATVIRDLDDPVRDDTALTGKQTPEEAAKALGIGRTTVYKLIGLGELRAVKVGGSRRVSAAALAEYVERLDRDAGPG